MAKTKKALEKYPVKTLVVAGGVAANQGLRERLADEITEAEVVIPHYVYVVIMREWFH